MKNMHIKSLIDRFAAYIYRFTAWMNPVCQIKNQKEKRVVL
jgi:hypothetical protein